MTGRLAFLPLVARCSKCKRPMMAYAVRDGVRSGACACGGLVETPPGRRLWEVAAVGPSGVAWGDAVLMRADTEDSLIWHLWRCSREAGGPPADRWSRRACWAFWRWRVVVERRQRA